MSRLVLGLCGDVLTLHVYVLMCIGARNRRDICCEPVPKTSSTHGAKRHSSRTNSVHSHQLQQGRPLAETACPCRGRQQCRNSLSTGEKLRHMHCLISLSLSRSLSLSVCVCVSLFLSHSLLPPSCLCLQPQCSLHLRMATDSPLGYSSIQSKRSAIGLILAQGVPTI